MNENAELVLGFDIRIEDQVGANNWIAKRRNEFLLRSDVLQPYSVDTTVWPSILDSNCRPNTCIGYQDLWSDLPGLRSFSSGELQSGVGGQLIAITLSLEKSSSEFTRWQMDVPPTIPAIRDNSWQSFGYVVADRWLLSGLSNCGFLPGIDDVTNLRTQWHGKLNDHHLFDAPEDARAFQSLSISRAAEHSPFFIFGIWWVQI